MSTEELRAQLTADVARVRSVRDNMIKLVALAVEAERPDAAGHAAEAAVRAKEAWDSIKKAYAALSPPIRAV